MDNIITLRPKLAQKTTEFNFDVCSDEFKKGFADGTLTPDKWFMFAVTSEGHPVVSVNGFTPGEIMFAMEAIKDWLMTQS